MTLFISITVNKCSLSKGKSNLNLFSKLSQAVLWKWNDTFVVIIMYIVMKLSIYLPIYKINVVHLLTGLFVAEWYTMFHFKFFILLSTCMWPKNKIMSFIFLYSNCELRPGFAMSLFSKKYRTTVASFTFSSFVFRPDTEKRNIEEYFFVANHLQLVKKQL